MKKLLSLCLAVTISSGICNAQQRYQKELLSENNERYLYFDYDSNRIDSIYEEQPDGYSAYRLFTYDEAGNNTIQKRYQMPKDASDYIYTDNVYFTYDNLNRVTTRKNYNLDIFGGTDNFILGGVYTYEYDADGRMSKSMLYWDEEKTRLFEKVTYEYDVDGRLINKTRESDQFGQFVADDKQEYEYDSEGRLVKVSGYTLDYSTGQLVVYNYITYDYDDNGNMIEMTAMIADETVTEKHEYKYDTTAKASETIYPTNPDDKNMLYTCSENIVTEDVIYMRDIKAGKLIYVDTEKWIYGDNSFAAINNVTSESVMSIISLSSDMVVLSNVKQGAGIRVYNEAGCIVNSSRYDNGIDISQLAKGVYMIVSDNSSIKIKK